MPVILTLCIGVSKHVRARGYFSKPEGALEQETLGITGVDCRVANIIWLLPSLLGRYISLFSIGVIQGYSERTEHFKKIYYPCEHRVCIKL